MVEKVELHGPEVVGGEVPIPAAVIPAGVQAGGAGGQRVGDRVVGWSYHWLPRSLFHSNSAAEGWSGRRLSHSFFHGDRDPSGQGNQSAHPQSVEEKVNERAVLTIGSHVGQQADRLHEEGQGDDDG